MDLELPDGTVVQGIPDGLTKAQITNKLVAAGYGGSLASSEDRAMADPTRDMSGFEKFRAGWGKKVADLGRGVQQIFTPDAPTLSGLVTGDNRSAIQREIDESKRLDAPLMKTGAGFAGNLVGGLSMAAPAMMVPGLNTYAGAAAVGGAQGLLEPVQTGGSRPMNTAIGAGAGVVGQGVGNVIGRAIRPVQPTVNPERDRLVQMATQQGIPLRASQVTGSRPLEITESVLENLPFSSGPALAAKQAQAEAYNQAVLGTAGIRGTAATPTSLATQKRALGSEFENIAGRNAVNVHSGLGFNLRGIADQAERRLVPDQAATVRRMTEDIIDAGSQGPMPGTMYQGFREELRRLSKGNDTQAHFFGQVKRELDNAFNAQVSAADAEAWRTASQQYGNLKTISNAMGGAGAQTKLGNIPPTQLEAAFTQNVGREGKALGRGGPLNDLVAIGRAFISDQIPNSGTAQRQFYQNLLTGGAVPFGGAGLGAGAAAAAGNDPLMGAAYGAGAMGISLLVPRLLQAGLSTNAVQRYLTQGLVALTPAERQMISAATTSAAIPLGILGAQR